MARITLVPKTPASILMVAQVEAWSARKLWKMLVASEQYILSGQGAFGYITVAFVNNIDGAANNGQAKKEPTETAQPRFT